MKSSLLCFIFLLLATNTFSQYDFEPSNEHPFGLPNPDAPEQITDWAPLIGECDCISQRRNPDGTWQDSTSMVWNWKYILNGMGVQDESWLPDGSYSGSIRQYIPDSSHWYVHFYSSRFPSAKLPAWEGNKTETGEIVLYNDQKAPNGMEGDYKITFYDITESGFKWKGEWVDKARTIVYPTWRISCEKRE